MKRVQITLLALFLLLVGVVAWQKNSISQKPAETVHFHAGFLVYIDGVLQDYSAVDYMNIQPCDSHGEKPDETPEHIQMEKAHLHDFVGDVVHVHRNGALWKDLFINIKKPLPSDKKIIGFVNGTEIGDFLNTPILADQSVVILVGENDGVDLAKTVTLERIKEIEAKSEACGADN